MKKFTIILIAGILFPFCASAQLGKLMSRFHEKNGITVTQLDKNVYKLYQRENLSPETKEMLQQLEEVNILNLDTEICDLETGKKLTTQFREILNNPDKYKLVKSRNDGRRKQLIYIQNKNGKTSDLAVWSETPEQIDIIELKGDIQLDRIASLSKALNLKGLNSLAMLSSNAPAEESGDSMDALGQMIQNFNGGHSDFDRMFSNFFGTTNDTIASLNPFGQLESMMDIFQDFNPDEWLKSNGTSHKMEKFFQSFGDGNNVISNSVQITEENGKTKLKIDSKNSDMTYIIDGQKSQKDNVQMPEKIVNVNIIPSREDMKKSYLFITSQNKLGSFTSYKDGVLTFKYDNQEYKYNLEKAQHPLLVVNGRLASAFSIKPENILQIRPVSQIEKEVGPYPNAAVIINTK